jgi:hypothetical protein
VRRVNHRVVARGAQLLEEADKTERVAERVRLLEGDDVHPLEPFRDTGAAAGEEKIDAGGGKRVAQRQGERDGEQGIADAVIGAHHQDATQLVEARAVAPERKEERGEARKQPRGKARWRVETVV